jgi:hypothetical protein
MWYPCEANRVVVLVSSKSHSSGSYDVTLQYHDQIRTIDIFESIQTLKGYPYKCLLQ